MQFLDREKLIPQVLGDRSELATTQLRQGDDPRRRATSRTSRTTRASSQEYAATLP